MRGRLDYPTETKAFKKIGALMSKKNFRVEEKLPSSYREAIDRFFKKQKNEDPEESEELNVQGKKKEVRKSGSSELFDYVERYANQVKTATHSVKPVHPDAKGTTLQINPFDFPELDEVGSHVLRSGYELDAVGNAPALKIYRFLKLEVNGRSLLSALESGDESALRALDDDPRLAESLRDKLLSIRSSEKKAYESHTLAKQLYWLRGADPVKDGDYCLIAPLYPAALVHVMYKRINNDRFEEAAKRAREARKSRCWHGEEDRRYEGLANQEMGGGHPDNISYLNKERRGINYLLSCAPPEWLSRGGMPVGRSTVFGSYFGRRPGVGSVVRRLRDFLKSDPPNNRETDKRRERYLECLIDELLMMAAELQQESIAGWSCDEERFGQLVEAEKLWLDPHRAEVPEQEGFALARLTHDWPTEVGRRFGNWLNAQLRDSLPVGDIESKEWARMLLSDDEFRRHVRRLGSDVRKVRAREDLETLPEGKEVS